MKIYYDTKNAALVINSNYYPANLVIFLFSENDTNLTILSKSSNKTLLSKTAITLLQREDGSYYTSKDDILNAVGTYIFKTSVNSTRFKDIAVRIAENKDIGISDPPCSISGLNLPYSFSDTAATYYISSSSNLDTGSVKLNLLTENDNGEWVEEKFSFQLEGQTKKAIVTNSGDLPIRINCISNARENNNAAFLGDIYVYEDTTVTDGVPDDLTKVRAIINVGYNKCKTTVYSIPDKLNNGEVVTSAEILRWRADLIGRRNADAELELKTRVNGIDFLEDSAYININKYHLLDWGNETGLKVFPKTDIRVDVKSVSSTCDITARIQIKVIAQ